MINFLKNNWWRLGVIFLVVIAGYCVGWMIWMSFVYGCDFETKQVKDSVVLGDLRIEKTEYWSGCWKDYYVVDEEFDIPLSVFSDTMAMPVTLFGRVCLSIPKSSVITACTLSTYLRETLSVIKDSLICDKCDSTVYNFYINNTYQLAVSIVDHGKNKSEGNYERGVFHSSLHSWSYGLIPREYKDTTLEVTESMPRVGQWVW